MSSLLERYGTRPVPRYTSYPPANVWRDVDGETFWPRALGAIARPLALYVHVPFCAKLCFYCGCNMLVTRSEKLVERYLAALELEVSRAATLAAKSGPVVQLHLGGGTPTHLDSAQLTQLVGTLQRHFPFSRGIEASIEVHPPVTTAEQLGTLASLGFNRVSMGVQDFDPAVQERVNRPQPFEQTRDLVLAARGHGFTSVNVDLMYGLPLQTLAGYARTLGWRSCAPTGWRCSATRMSRSSRSTWRCWADQTCRVHRFGWRCSSWPTRGSCAPVT